MKFFIEKKSQILPNKKLFCQHLKQDNLLLISIIKQVILQAKYNHNSGRVKNFFVFLIFIFLIYLTVLAPLIKTGVKILG
ncbi:MAG: hypothetical protein AAGJ08_26985, partial [Cyanobacteria bacterium P01_H01_bin.35]